MSWYLKQGEWVTARDETFVAKVENFHECTLAFQKIQEMIDQIRQELAPLQVNDSYVDADGDVYVNADSNVYIDTS